MDSNTKTWAMILHLSFLLGHVTGFGYLAPVVIWALKKDEMPELDEHGKMVINFIISMFIYTLICIVLIFLVVGVFLLPVLGIIGIIYPIIGGVKANSGELWNYPGIFKFV